MKILQMRRALKCQVTEANTISFTAYGNSSKLPDFVVLRDLGKTMAVTPMIKYMMLLNQTIPTHLQKIHWMKCTYPHKLWMVLKEGQKFMKFLTLKQDQQLRDGCHLEFLPQGLGIHSVR
jgi:hypothetical protein